MNSKLVLADGSIIEGKSYGSNTPVSGEVVFATGMMGYPESLTDPSFYGQILVLTYPLIGNYGVPDRALWESDNIMVSGLVVSDYIDTPSHFQSKRTLAEWFKDEKKPLIQIKDTRLLTQKIRDKGSMLGKILFEKDIPFYDPNFENLVEKVSTKKITVYKPKDGKAKKTILLIDCGAKRNIQNALVERGVKVITTPWDYDPTDKENIKALHTVILPARPLGGSETKNLPNNTKTLDAKKTDQLPYDGIVISNGPGDPKYADATIQNVKKILDAKIPTLGICLGHQILSLAAGGDTKKLKYGHRSQNQPCTMHNSQRCFITTQNHGFAVHKIPEGFEPWFTNANDNSNEGIIHKKLPVMSTQFHPEATPGPEDAEWIFDYFLEKLEL
jgi:carbamoyl-phosphate synthase small subunit